MKTKIIIGVLVAGLLIGGGAYYYGFHIAAKHEDPLQSKDKIVIKAKDLFALYTQNEDSANHLYLDSVISVTGEVKQVDLNEGRYTISLSTGDSSGTVICEMDPAENEKIKKLSPGNVVTLDGFCNGLLIDVQLDRCKFDEQTTSIQ